jgi:hypothetical protein
VPTTSNAVAKEAVEAWNIATRYLPESDSYPRVTAENIPESLGKNLNVFNDLVCFRNGTENPRVGGSIPPLATTKSLNFQQLFVGRFWRT